MLPSEDSTLKCPIFFQAIFWRMPIEMPNLKIWYPLMAVHWMSNLSTRYLLKILEHIEMTNLLKITHWNVHISTSYLLNIAHWNTQSSEDNTLKCPHFNKLSSEDSTLKCPILNTLLYLLMILEHIECPIFQRKCPFRIHVPKYHDYMIPMNFILTHILYSSIAHG